MDDFSTYHLSDFILFSETTYYRQFEIYNQTIWPLHILAGLLACLLLFAAWKKPGWTKPAWSGRLIAAILVISWLWVAYGFLYQSFYQIHVVANWYAFGFVIQAGLIAWFGLLKDRFAVPGENGVKEKSAMLLIVMGIAGYPFIALISGRPWQQFEMFALAPDPTAFVTLGLFLFYKNHVSCTAKILFVIPVCWLLISYTTQYVM